MSLPDMTYKSGIRERSSSSPAVSLTGRSNTATKSTEDTNRCLYVLFRGIRRRRIRCYHDTGMLLKRPDRLYYQSLGKNRIASLQSVNDARVPLNALNPLAFLRPHGMDDHKREKRHDDSPESLHQHAVPCHLRHQ